MAFEPTHKVVYHPFDSAKDRYYLHGQQVDKQTYLKQTKSKIKQVIAEGAPDGQRSNCWPQVSHALACATENQRKRMFEKAKEAGVRLDFDKRGGVILESVGHRKQVARFFNHSDWDAGYSDPVGNNIQEAL